MNPKYLLSLTILLSGCDVSNISVVSANTMAPSINKGETIQLINCSDENSECNFSHGEIYAFNHPNIKDVTYFSRILGKPGDHIKFINKSTYLNGVLLKTRSLGQIEIEKYICEKFSESINEIRYEICRGPGRFNPRLEYSDIKLSENEYFFVSDNRENSIDSRIFGPILLSAIKARVIKVSEK
ncbi:signal peptidase I [Leucothrix pacifica]|uniref:Signal peptidase I n=1 Tax=Leucothrix pacifica TaxID=1247513 RepID=A0A317C2N5_9GAMM|nr:signal peptidase I [Leucothrix pacifica]PWQ92884.1 signal peptidase I [Leucothrix pacifica]